MKNNPASGKAVLFDVDGTLLDTVPLIVETFQHVFQTWLGHPGDLNEILSGIGKPLELCFSQYPPKLAQAMLEDYLNFNMQHLQTNIGIFMGIPQLLASLRELGIPMGIVTSKRFSSLRPSLRDFELEEYFQVLIAKESTARHKPHADPVLEGMRQLGLTDPSKIIFVGDSIHDLLSARNAGCRSAIVDWTRMPVDELKAAAPDFWLTSPMQLLENLDTI